MKESIPVNGGFACLRSCLQWNTHLIYLWFGSTCVFHSTSDPEHRHVKWKQFPAPPPPCCTASHFLSPSCGRRRFTYHSPKGWKKMGFYCSSGTFNFLSFPYQRLDSKSCIPFILQRNMSHSIFGYSGSLIQVFTIWICLDVYWLISFPRLAALSHVRD